MNDTPQDAWFYSRDGEKIGPVTLEFLRIKVSEAGLNPRLDMVWTQGMDEWKPAGEIEGLFERRTAPEPQESLAPPANPYTPPGQESAAQLMGKQGEWPGARRRSYLIALFIFPMVWAFGIAAAIPFFTSQFGPEIMKFAQPGLQIVPIFVSLYFALQRLVNVGMSRWWYLGQLVPFLNIWVGYRLFACPGGYAYHKKLDGAGIFLAIIYWLLVAIVVLAIAALIALLAGAIGTPELRQQIQDAVRNFSDAVRAASVPKA